MSALLAFLALLSAGTAQTQTAAPAAPSTPSAPTLFVIRYRPGPAYRPGVPLLRQNLREHGRYMQALAERGVIVAAGPTLAPEGGIVLIQAAGLDEARAHMAADPAVIAGIFVGEISDWRPFIDPGGRFRPQ